MKTNNWRDIAELVGIGAIVASLVFVGFQLRQEEEIAEAEGRLDLVVTTIELARLFSDNEVVWRKGLLGDPLSEHEQVKFDTLVRVYYLDRIMRFARARLSVNKGARGDPTRNQKNGGKPKQTSLCFY